MKGQRRISELKRGERRLPIGAEVIPRRGVHFRVWAPRRRKVSVVVENATSKRRREQSFDLNSDKEGYYSGLVPGIGPGTLYRFRLDDSEKLVPDPVSRFQPLGPEGPSQVVDPSVFRWGDQVWPGVRLKGQVIYEMHLGTFTREGTWKSALSHHKELAELGITLIEVMPVAEFPGAFGWGYDGVNLFAPYHGYGTPDDFRSFVNHAHAQGLGVILDVVYNHFAPGSMLGEFSFDYVSARYETDWGRAYNFDGNNCGPVREFVLANVGYWIDEFHLDGLRLDATQSIFDDSKNHILEVATRQARKSAGRRPVVIVAENEPQDTRLIRRPEDGGYGLDGVWNDDFHHTARVALTGGSEAYYTDYLGSAQEFISAAKWGYLYQGQFYSWQDKCRGIPWLQADPASFIHFIENHDQVANSARGDRLHVLAHPGKYRAVTAFLLLTPNTPLLFQGEEFCSSNPFFFFADHSGELGREVRSGRVQFMSQFRNFQDPDAPAILPDPTARSTFESCKLDHSERLANGRAYLLHRDLLKLRREDEVFKAQRSDWMHGAVLGPDLFLLRFLGEENGDRLILVNLGMDRLISPAPEPLLAPPAESHWVLLWSSESVEYGGSGTPAIDPEGKWLAPGNATLVFAPKKVGRSQP